MALELIDALGVAAASGFGALLSGFCAGLFWANRHVATRKPWKESRQMRDLASILKPFKCDKCDK